MTGFMGMGMAMNQGGGMNAQNLFAMGQQQQEQQAQQMAAQQAAQQAVQPAGTAGRRMEVQLWKLLLTGKFCPECGSKKPEPQPAPGAWKCKCGATATGKFCPECGSPKPVEEEG